MGKNVVLWGTPCLILIYYLDDTPLALTYCFLSVR